MLDKIDRKLLSLLQTDCTLSLQALADAVNLTTTPCWKRLKRLEDEQHAFETFLQRLREAKDKQEFDRFMDERASVATADPQVEDAPARGAY